MPRRCCAAWARSSPSDERGAAPGTASNLYTIAPGLSFLDSLAAGILARWGADQLALARVRIYLPTRRDCRSLGEAFLRASDGRALVLPRMTPLGDLDAEELLLAEDAPLGPGLADLPPVLAALRRKLLLTRLILSWARRTAPIAEDQAARMADELARLIDQVETEGLDFAALATLVPEDYAAHWQTTLKFLSIVTEQWPDVQRAHGAIGPAERRGRLLEAQAAAWRAEPPQEPGGGRRLDRQYPGDRGLDLRRGRPASRPGRAARPGPGGGRRDLGRDRR